MATRNIEVDDEVYTALQRAARPFVETTPNEVLRRLLLGESHKGEPRGAGDLMPLLEEGRLRAGDRLIHHQPRRNRTFTAEVTEDGYIRLENGSEFAKPSPALRACVGSEVNGWGQWKVERTGRPLQDLRHA
jgi:hypothetical protein